MKVDTELLADAPPPSPQWGRVASPAEDAAQPDQLAERDARCVAYRFGPCELLPRERLLLIDGERSNIGGRAFDVLLALIESRSRMVSKDELLERVWPGLQVEENNLSTQVSALRRVVGREAIATVAGQGYRFTASVECVEGRPSPAASAGSATPAPVATTTDDVLRFDAIEWRPAERLVMIDGRRAAMGSRAMDLLDVLIAERHRVVSKRELLERVWPGMVVEETNLQVQISALRKSLGKDVVATVPGRGYRFTMRPAGSEAPAVPDVPREVPARTNLPHAVEALLGRAEELEQLSELLAAHRLLTIVGAGGIGKTRAAQALVHGQVVRFPHGVWWIDLAALASPDEVAPTIAAAARVELGPGDVVRQLALALESRTTLIVLDNCEHLVEEVSRLVAAVLDVASNVRFVATSQEPLRIVGEQLFRLGGLRVPPVGISLDEARRYGALLLLERRARAVDARFAMTELLLPTAIDLCRQLDGMPLAIEMAAARVPQLGLAVLHAGLGERLQWLRGRARTAMARHQTLRAMLDWSYSLLGKEEQFVLRRLAVFAGSFGLEAAKGVACDSSVDCGDETEAMANLVDRSLIQVDDSDPPRYRLLESVRLYAREQLQAHGETFAAQAAHMRLMASVGDEAEQAFWTTPDEPWLARYGAEYEDLHMAFMRASDVHDATVGAATLDALYRLDELRGMPLPLTARLPTACAMLSYAEPQAALRIRLVLASLFLAHNAVQDTPKLEWAKPAVELAQALGDVPQLYRAWMSVMVHATVAGNNEVAVSALAKADALENPSWPARLKWFGAVHRTHRHALRGDVAAAMSSLRAELTYAEQAGASLFASNARATVADLSLICGDVVQAIRLGLEAVDEARSQGRDNLLGTVLANLCAAFLVAGELKRAGEVASEAIEVIWRHGRFGMLLDHLSFLAAQAGRFEDSMLLIGFTDAWLAGVQYTRESNEAAAVRSAMALNEQALGIAPAAHLRKRGESLSATTVKDMALACINAVRQ